MITRRWLAAATIALVVAASAGAGFIYYRDVAAIRQVEVTVADASLPDDFLVDMLRNQSLTITIHMQLRNPAGWDISNMGTHYDIYILDMQVGDGGFSGVDVEGHGSANKTMKFTLSLSDVTAGILDAIKQKSFTVTLDGRVTGEVLFGLATFQQPFTTSYAFP